MYNLNPHPDPNSDDTLTSFLAPVAGNCFWRQFLAPVVWYHKLWHTLPANDTGKNKTSMGFDVVAAVIALRLLIKIQNRSSKAATIDNFRSRLFRQLVDKILRNIYSGLSHAFNGPH